MRKGFSKIRPVLLYDQAFGNRPLPPEKIPKEDVLQTFESWPHSLPISSCPPPSFQEKWKQSCLLLHAWPYVRGKCIFLPAFPHFHRPLPYTLPLLAAFMYNPSPPFSHSFGGGGFWALPWVSSLPCFPLGGCRYSGNPPDEISLLHVKLLLGKHCSRNRQCCVGCGLLVVRRGQILCSASESRVVWAQNGWILLEVLCKISWRYAVWLLNAAVPCKKKWRTFVVYAVFYYFTQGSLEMLARKMPLLLVAVSRSTHLPAAPQSVLAALCSVLSFPIWGPIPASLPITALGLHSFCTSWASRPHTVSGAQLLGAQPFGVLPFHSVVVSSLPSAFQWDVQVW